MIIQNVTGRHHKCDGGEHKAALDGIIFPAFS